MNFRDLDNNEQSNLPAGIFNNLPSLKRLSFCVFFDWISIFNGITLSIGHNFFDAHWRVFKGTQGRIVNSWLNSAFKNLATTVKVKPADEEEKRCKMPLCRPLFETSNTVGMALFRLLMTKAML